MVPQNGKEQKTWSTVLIQKRREKFNALAVLKSTSQKEFSKSEKKKKSNPTLQRHLMKERNRKEDTGVRGTDLGLKGGGEMLLKLPTTSVIL